MPDWGKMQFDKAILRESGADGNRLVLWVAGDRDRRFQHWQRIANVLGAKITIHQGLCSTAAIMVPARQRVHGWVGKFLKRFWGALSDEAWILPSGESAEAWGQRRTDLILAWAKEEVDEARIRSRWPGSQDVRQIGPNIFLVSGVNPRGRRAARPEVPLEKGCPRKAGRQMLAAARKAGDRRAEATALADLGVMRLQERKTRIAIALLVKAAALARELGDRVMESEILGNLGKATLAAGQRNRARLLFRRSLSKARKAHDCFAEKIALEHLGTFFSRIHNPTRALVLFGKALRLAAKTGDRHHEAKLLWQLAIAHAELGQPAPAIVRAQSAIAVFEGLGRPESAWFANHLQKYQASTALPKSNGASLAGTLPALAAFSTTSIEASAIPVLFSANSVPDQTEKPIGDHLLHMAVSATKAMAKFIKSGMKLVPPTIYEERLQTCAGCGYHSGLRCRICGCFTNMKAKMPHEKCPVDKWPLYVNPQLPK